MVAAAVVGSAVVGAVGSSMQADAAGDAADAQSQSAANQIAESRRQFDEIRKLLQPYTEAGGHALFQQQGLLGMFGQGFQKDLINNISNGPQMAEMVRQGENSILQNASATGGLRGGNTQAALAQFRPALLNQLIDQQYNRLGGLSTMGQNSAAGVGAAGQNSSNQIMSALQQQGAAGAGAALARGNAGAGLVNSLGQAAGYAFGGNGMFGSSTGYTGALNTGGQGVGGYGEFASTPMFGGGTGFGDLGSGFYGMG